MPRRQPWQSLLAFIALAIAMRWGSFFISVINSDESTYIVIAEELLRGKVYLRDVVDTKPIGIFWIYAALIKLTGGSILALRVAAAVIVGLGGWLVARCTTYFTDTAIGGYVAGFTYLLMTSIFKFYGVSPNTEIFFNCCTIAAVSLTVASDRKRWVAAGLLLGTGFIIKPFVAAEALAIGLYLVWFYRSDIPRTIGNGLLLVAAFLLPVAGTIAYFAHLDLLPELWFYSVDVGSGYRIGLTWLEHALYMGDYLLRYSPLIVAGIWAGTRVQASLSDRQRGWLRYLLLQFALVMVVVLVTGKRFGHYQIQLHPVVAMWVGTTVGLAFTNSLSKRWVGIAAVVASLILGFVHFFYYDAKIDEPQLIADYLLPRLGEGETVFMLTSLQVTYHLIDRPVPVPYVHPSLLFNPIHHQNFGIDEAKEADRVLADSSVRYVVSREDDPALDTGLARRLMTGFRESDRSKNGIVYYQRIER